MTEAVMAIITVFTIGRFQRFLDAGRALRAAA